MPLDKPVTVLKGVGPQLAEKLARLHVHTLQDVLFHLPHRFEDRTQETPIGALLPEQHCVITAQIELAQVVFGRRRSLLVKVSDGSGFLSLRLFYFSRSQERAFKRGHWVRCFGEVRRGAKGYELIHPEYKIFANKPEGGLEQTLTPVYPTTEGLSQLIWRKMTDQVLAQNLNQVVELLPQSLLNELEFGSLQAAIHHLHRPPAGTHVQAMQQANSAAHQRLIVEELLAHHFSIKKSRDVREHESANVLTLTNILREQLTNVLPFELTQAQRRCEQQISMDLAKSQPMMRLLQGDVGSGKTVVAAYAILHAVSCQQQAVLMAPTELLAEQHYQTLTRWFAELDIEVGWLASKTPAAQRRETIEKLQSGELLVVVGTHALFQEAVDYQCLALAVIDEQHRFGVDQRLSLRNKMKQNCLPHQLLMTATPIPRTLAMSFYADLDVSSIDELPPGRQPVTTTVMSAEEKRAEIIERVRHACEQGRQAYWVCPLIDDSEVLEAQAATETHQELQEALAGLNVGLVHGRMKPTEKETVMARFRHAQIDVLVATTVIEVGVDVPNASLMIIENSERMGLAQLHQLRGRVGRGSEQSFCILLYQQPLSQFARQRLKILRETNDGFVIAEEDLKLRGAGELLGTRQTGNDSFKIADLLRDQHWLPKIESAARQIQADHPDYIDKLIGRWIGSKQDYVNV